MSKTNNKASTEVAAPAATALVAVDLAALGATDDYDNMGRSDVAVPFLKILQALSPQCTVGSSDYDPDARPGMISHSITKAILGTSVRVTPVAYKRSYLEWVPRKQGGGFRGEFEAATHEPIFNRLRSPETGKAILENGNELIETLTFFALLHNADGVEPIIISMSISQAGAARTWNQIQQTYAPPGAPKRPYKRYIANYLLSTDMKRKDQNTWFVWKVSGATANTPEVIAAAQAFEAQIRGGAIVVDHSAAQEPVATEDDAL